MEGNTEHHTHTHTHTHTQKKKKKRKKKRKVEQSTTIEFKRRKRDWNGEPKLASDGLLMT